MNSRRWLGVVLGLVLAGSGCGGTMAGAGKEYGTPAGHAAVAAAAAPSLVRVQYTLHYDKGEEPQAAGWTNSTCPVRRFNNLNTSATIREERPLEFGGFLVSPKQVVTADPIIHPRFIEKIEVRRGQEVAAARVSAYAKTCGAIILELAAPLKDARPLAFDADRQGPYLGVVYEPDEGTWAIGVSPFAPAIRVGEDGRRYCEAPLRTLVVNEAGVAVGLSIDGELPADDSWKGSPLSWPVWTADEKTQMVEALQKRCDQSVLRVTLHFRSPSKDAGARMRFSRDDEGVTELQTNGVVLEGGKILVLANLKPKVTARLERVVVHPAEGEDVGAKFACTLKDYGCFVATLDKPLPQAARFAVRPLVECRGVLLPAADIAVEGENRIAYFNYSRINGLHFGWRQQVYPETGGREERLFLFDPDGAILALPVAQREKVSVEEQYSSSRAMLTPAVYLKAAIADLAKNVDPQNVPLTEDLERRLAWLGVELQGLNKELARANKVADLTRDGKTGAVISYVYPDSPAAKAGIEPGFLLLRLRVEGQPKPLDVEIEQDRAEAQFPWDRLDELSEPYYDRIPAPWPSVENRFLRALTDLGFGTKFSAEFFHDGRLVAKDFEVTQSPPYYDSAARYKAVALGLTVRDLTYEVRRYLQRAAEEPGVVISKIEPGSKASTAGVKPFEVITHVNEKPVMNVKDFEEVVGKATGELRLSVKRMTKGRVVKINMAAAAPKPAPEKGAGEDKGAAGEKPAGEGGASAPEAPKEPKPPVANPPANAPKP